MNFRHAGLILMAFMLGAEYLSADGSAEPAASLAAPLETFQGSARAMAMGNASVALADGSASLFSNPAGLAFMRQTELGIHHNTWLLDSYQETLVFGANLGSWGGLGLGASYLDFGSFEVRDASGRLTGSQSAFRPAAQAGWGKELLEGLSLGLAAKGQMTNLGEATYSGFSGDIGLMWRPLSFLDLAAAYTNLGTQIAGYSQASSVNLGACITAPFTRDNQMIFSVAGGMEPQGVSRVNFGAEEKMFSMLALRAGYMLDLVDAQLGGLNSFTVGAGFSIQSMNLDYALLPFGDLGYSHRVSLSYAFSGNSGH